jgi:aryl-alcohol dehydrogenase-like predicted oxidoreductase
VRTRRIGATTVTAVGSGELSLATSAARGVPARELEHALHEAIGLGITVLDITADADSERLAGQAVRAQRARDRVVVATRVPLLDPRPGAPRRDTLRERLPPAYLQDRIEAALRATRLEALPLAQLALLPAWTASPAWPELVGTCARLVREGKVIAWGAWLDELPADPADPALAALAAEPWLAALSVVYHLCDRRAEPLLPAAAARELAVLARHPLAGGALAGSLGPGVKLPPRDDRSDLGAATLERIAVGVARLAGLVKREPPAARSCDAAREIAERAARARPAHLECSDLADLALRFVLDRGAIALPRLHRPAHLVPALAAAAAPALSADLAAEIDRILDDRA